MRRGEKFSRKLAIKSAGKIELVTVDDIDWIEADGNYVSIHTGARTHLMRETLGNLQRRLDPNKFARIHRSYLVNVDHVQRLDPDSHGEFAVELADGTHLTLTRTYRDDFLRRFDVDA